MLVAFALVAIGSTGVFRVPNGLFYDIVATTEPGRQPQVILVEQDAEFAATGAARHARLARAALQNGMARVAFAFDPKIAAGTAGRLDPSKIIVGHPARRVPGTSQWELLGNGQSPDHINAAYVVAKPDHGIQRRQLRWLPGQNSPIPVFESAATGQTSGQQSFLLRLSHNQNLPRVTATQILAGTVDRAALQGKIALIAPQPGIPTRILNTALNAGESGTPAIEFNAAAIQTLADQRPVRMPSLLGSALMLITTALVLCAALMVFDPKKIVLPMLVGALVLVPLGSVALIIYGNVLPPVGELILGLLLAAPLAFYNSQIDEENRLKRFIAQLVNYSSRRTLLKDDTRLTKFLVSSARSLGISKMLLLEKIGGKLIPLEEIGCSADELESNPRIRRAILRRARKSQDSADAAPLFPDWPEDVRIAEIGSGSSEIYWIYTLDTGKGGPSGETIAAELAQNYREYRRWRKRVSAASQSRLRDRRIEEWVGNAANQIANQGEQVRDGIDRLETAVLIFHFLGFPLHANDQMEKLYQSAGLSLTDSTLPEALSALSGLDETRITAMLHDLMLHGGQARVKCRDIDAHSRLLRISSPPAQDDIVRIRNFTLEVIDVTELRKLIDLRLSVANFLDSQLRNDLEAIILATGIARDPRMKGPALDGVLAQIDRAASRTVQRLEDLAPQALDQDGSSLKEYYPIDARLAVKEAQEKVQGLAIDLGVKLQVEMPEVSGFSIAEPGVLTAMIETMLRIVVSDTPKGETARLIVREEEAKTLISVTGGIGTSFERLYAALGATNTQTAAPYRGIVSGMNEAVRWGAIVSYSSEIGKGYRFMISLRRIG